MAQREAAHWYFGTYAGLDFNSGSPRPLFDGQIRTVEGCEAFSDADGNLLFYTEGSQMFNRLHELMPNGDGLKGSFSTTQSALAVPNPSNNGIYYVFTPDDVLAYRLENSNGFNYSVVDMNADFGNGDVIQKNVDLLERCSEKVSAVLGNTGDFYWVVTHYLDSFYSYRVDATGVDSNPVVSNVGPLIDNFENFRGALKVSPNGKNIAIAHTVLRPEYSSNLLLFEFDTTTGRVSNPLDLSGDIVYYGVEFSANSKVLYASGRPILNGPDGANVGSIQIMQFDLTVPDIRGSEYELARFPLAIGTEISGSLQLGIDKKVYHSVPGNKLSVIRTPNLTGFDADFRMMEVNLGDRSATYGLPPFIQSLFETVVSIENLCAGDVTEFSVDTEADISSIQWNFGDPGSGSQNTSGLLNPTHQFTSDGVFTVELEVSYASGLIRNFIEFVEIAEVPAVASEISLVQCDSDGADDGVTTFNLDQALPLFNNGNPDIKGVYFSNLDDALLNENQLDALSFTNEINNQRIYARAFENSQCFSIVEIVLIVEPMSDLGNYTTLDVCINEPAGLATWVPLQPIRDVLQQDFGPQITIGLYATEEQARLEQELLSEEEKVFGPFDERALYFRLENDNRCSGLGKIDLNTIYRPDYEELVKVDLCNGLATLEGPSGYEDYRWSTGQSGEVITVNEPGSYEVAFNVGPCSYTQQIEVLPNSSLELEQVDIFDFKTNNRIEIRVVNPAADILYSIDNGRTYQNSPIFANLDPGLYQIRISNNCTEITEEVIVGGMNAFFTPNGDGVNDLWTLTNSEFFPKFQISIFDRYGTLLKSFDENYPGWDGTFGNRDLPSDDYWYMLEFDSGRTVRGHFSLKR